MSPAPALAAALAMTPLLAAVVWQDMARLRIPNGLVLGVVAVFGVCGLWGLPLDVFALALVAGIAVLAAGVLIHNAAAGHVGAGDLKLIAALTPFIAWRDLGGLLLLWAVVTVAGLMVHRLARAVARGRVTGWAAIDQSRFFPLGVLLGVTMILYLWWRVGNGV